jgi:hypothetical protein
LQMPGFFSPFQKKKCLRLNWTCGDHFFSSDTN